MNLFTSARPRMCFLGTPIQHCCTAKWRFRELLIYLRGPKSSKSLYCLALFEKQVRAVQFRMNGTDWSEFHYVHRLLIKHSFLNITHKLEWAIEIKRFDIFISLVWLGHYYNSCLLQVLEGLNLPGPEENNTWSERNETVLGSSKLISALVTVIEGQNMCL